jgi:hypothetical protein
MEYKITDEQLIFLRKCLVIGIDKLIDTKDYWGLSSISEEESILWPESKLIDFKEKCPICIPSWDKRYLESWIQDFIKERIYTDGNDKEILN